MISNKIKGTPNRDFHRKWAPNHACVEAMVRSAGFSIVAHPGHEIYVCEPNPDEPHVGKQLREAELQSLFATGGRR